MKTIIKLALFLVALGAVCTGILARAADKPTVRLTLAVVPRVPPAQTYAQWSGFVARLARETGTEISLQVFKSISEFEQVVYAGKADLVYINPYQQVIAKRTHGYLPLVREGTGGLSGALVVARDSAIRQLQDLQGTNMVFPHPNAFGASLYLRALLSEQYGIRFTPHYVDTHSNVYRHVLRGLAAAGGGVNITLHQEPPEVQAGLRVLFETPPVAPHPLSVHPRVPASLREAILRSVINMANDVVGRAHLASVNLRQPIPADYLRDYAVLEKLKLEKYYVSTTKP